MQNKQTINPPKNPQVVHLNGRVLLQSLKRNTVFCGVLSAIAIVIVISMFTSSMISLISFYFMTALAVFIPFLLLAYLIKICFIDGAMGALIIRGNKNQPIAL